MDVPAVEFYKKCGAEIDEDSFICDFDTHGIDNYLTKVAKKRIKTFF